MGIFELWLLIGIPVAILNYGMVRAFNADIYRVRNQYVEESRREPDSDRMGELIAAAVGLVFPPLGILTGLAASEAGRHGLRFD